MNILFLEWGCFGKVDAVFTLKQQGHKIFFFKHPDYLERISHDFESAFIYLLKKIRLTCVSLSTSTLYCHLLQKNTI